MLCASRIGHIVLMANGPAGADAFYNELKTAVLAAYPEFAPWAFEPRINSAYRGVYARSKARFDVIDRLVCNLQLAASSAPVNPVVRQLKDARAFDPTAGAESVEELATTLGRCLANQEAESLISSSIGRADESCNVSRFDRIFHLRGSGTDYFFTLIDAATDVASSLRKHSEQAARHINPLVEKGYRSQLLAIADWVESVRGRPERESMDDLSVAEMLSKARKISVELLKYRGNSERVLRSMSRLCEDCPFEVGSAPESTSFNEMITSILDLDSSFEDSEMDRFLVMSKIEAIASRYGWYEELSSMLTDRHERTIVTEMTLVHVARFGNSPQPWADVVPPYNPSRKASTECLARMVSSLASQDGLVQVTGASIAG